MVRGDPGTRRGRPVGSKNDHKASFKGKRAPSSSLMPTKDEPPVPRNERETHSSRFVGVSWCRNLGMWRCAADFKGENHHLGYFKDELTAARSYDKMAERIGKAMNFPKHKGQKQARKMRLKPTKERKGPSRYVGVTWEAAMAQWRAAVWLKGTAVLVGHYDGEKEAALEYDTLAVKHGKPLNFPKKGQRQAVKMNRKGCGKRAIASATKNMQSKKLKGRGDRDDDCDDKDDDKDDDDEELLSILHNLVAQHRASSSSSR